MSAKEFSARFINADQDGRMAIVAEAQEKLSNTQMKLFKKQVKEIEAEEQEAESDSVAGEPTPGPSTSGGVEKEVQKGKNKAGLPIEDVVITDQDAEVFWKELERMDGNDLLNDQVIADFQYVGFDPNQVMKSIIAAGKSAKKSNLEILSDIAKMCTIAIIKGSITDQNLKKMSDNGKRSYGAIEATYNLKRGGSKGVDPKVVTIARVGAAFPGSMIKILMKKPDLAKKFSGPFGSKTLPPYLRHQSAAACIPETLDEAAKSFLIGLIIAYTSDQSKVISKTKDKPEELFDRQENFISSTHGSSYPSEDVRKSIFKQWTLVADFEKLNSVAVNINKIVRTFELISKEDFQTAVSAV